MMEDNEMRSILRMKNSIIMKIILMILLANVFVITRSHALTLDTVTYAALPGDNVRVTLAFDGPAFTPEAFTTDNPARIALDFKNVSSDLSSTNIPINVGMASSVAVIEAMGKTRVVVNMVKLVPYHTIVTGNLVHISLGKVNANTVVTQKVIRHVQPKARSRSIENIDFRRGTKGEGKIIIDLGDASIVGDVREEGDQLIAEFRNVSLNANLERRLDVLDFATPVKYIDTLKKNRNVTIKITPNGTYNHLMYQTGRVLILELRPITKKEKEAEEKSKFIFVGEKLSLNFQDIEIRAVLQLLADFTDLNIIVSDTVSGNLTLRLKNVPWDQALDIILKTKGLAMRRTGNVILVAPTEEISAREKLELESKKQLKELEPLRNEIIQINYSKAREIQGVLKSSDNSLLSERGKVGVDTRTNSLMILETASKIAEIRKLILILDVPVRQVLIESRVVTANEDFANDLGVRFGFTGLTDDGNNRIFSTSGNVLVTDALTQGAINNLQNTGQPFPITYPEALDDRLNVNLPGSPAGTPGRFAMAILGSKYLVDMELAALQTEGRGEVISSPRLIATDRKEAKIEQGTEIPYAEASSSGAATVAFKSAVLSLTVTPQITPDDRIILDLEVSKDSPDFSRILAGGAPPIDTRKIKTSVLINNGETVVLGGIYEQTESLAISKIPILGDIPFLGVMFRDRSKRDNKTELLIFVTPKIVKESFKVN